MRSRVLIVAVLALTSLICSSGTAFGASALSTDTNSSSTQYGTPNEGDVQNQQAVPSGPRAGAQQVKAVAVAAQAPRQLESSSDTELPFTGLAVISVLLIGLALLTSGLVLRRRAAASSSLR